MGGFFGTISKTSCVTDLFYGTDYNSHLGTRRGGMATYDKEGGFTRSIHNLENSYFRTKFESGLHKFKGNAGIGIISDTDAQPIVFNSHLGRFAIVTVASYRSPIRCTDDEFNRTVDDVVAFAKAIRSIPQCIPQMSPEIVPSDIHVILTFAALELFTNFL